MLFDLGKPQRERRTTLGGFTRLMVAIMEGRCNEAEQGERGKGAAYNPCQRMRDDVDGWLLMHSTCQLEVCR